MNNRNAFTTKLSRLRPCLGLAVFALAATGCDDATRPLDSVLGINTTTTGAAFDADDYVVLVDGVELERRLGLNSYMSIPGEPGQTIELELTDVADNCQVEGGGRRSVTLVEGSETRVSYDVHCVAPAGLEDARLVLASADFADLALAIVGGVELAANLYTLSLNGGAEGPVTTDGWNFHPAVSADGSTIAFTRGTDVYAMDADGLNPRRITNDGQSTDPSWSPDGMRIVYRFGDRLRILRLDDGEILSLATPFGAREPVWSPDGSRIAFSSPGGIYTIAPDGGEAVLEAAGGRAPVWAPVAGRLAYAKEGSVYVIGLNDEEGARLVPGSQGMWMTPTDWSPDGEWIAVNRGTVYLLHVENGTTVRATLDDRCDAVFVPGA